MGRQPDIWHSGHCKRYHTTETQRAKLRHQKAILECQIEASLDAILVISDKQERIAINNRFINIWNLPEEILAHKSAEKAIPWMADRVFDSEAFEKRIRALFCDTQQTSFEEVRLKNGKTLEQYTSPVIDAEGQFYGRIWQYRDITAERRSDLALRMSESRKDAILNSALDAIITIDQYSSIVEFNPAAERIFGYTQDEVLGMPMSEMIVPPKYREAHNKGMEHFLKTGEGPVLRKRIEIVGMRSSGEEFPIELAITPLVVDNFQYFTAYVRDITERKETEKDLIDAKDMAEQSARAKEQFLANMSHEIRTPLNAVIGLSHLLHDTILTEKQNLYLSGIKYSADNLLALINDILDFTKIDAGMIELEQIPFELNPLIQSLVSSHLFSAQKKGVALNTTIDPEIPKSLIGDPYRLSQILGNLLSNAVKYTHQGDVCLSVELDYANKNDVVIVFSVKDTGIGIPAEKVDLIMDAFVQASSDVTRIYGGTGLGLSIVKELTELQAGTIEIESKEGVGSTFKVTIPFSKSTNSFTGPPVKKQPNTQNLEGLHILLVEDNEMNQLVASDMLTNWGAKVHVANNGKLAIEALEEHPFDLVLMDIQMPIMDGYATTRFIREELGIDKATLPIIALTASAIIEQKAKAIALGMNDFIPKPFEPKILLNKIGQYSQLDLDQMPDVHDTSSAANSEGDINLDFLKKQTNHDNQLLNKIINLFLEKSDLYKVELEKATSENKIDQILFIAHKLKSSAGMLGAVKLEAELRNIEIDINEGSELDRIPDRVQKILALLKQAVNQLNLINDLKTLSP